MGHVFIVRVGGVEPVGICATLDDARELARRYLALCWPAANPEPRETYDLGTRTESYHEIPAGEYSGGERLPVVITTVPIWSSESAWPRAWA